mgnify:CR=1 FL=1
MTRLSRPRRAPADVTVVRGLGRRQLLSASLGVGALLLAGCADEADAPAGGQAGSPSGTGSDTSSDTSNSEPTTSSSSSSTATTSGADPEVDITSSAAEPVPASEEQQARDAVDDGAVATGLSIPAVGLQTDLVAQGLRGGKVNPLPDQVIWFTGYDRVSPGATGTSVIAGHVVNQDGPDRFAALEGVSTGDTVMLTYSSGDRLTFAITRAEVVDKTDLQSDPDVWGDNDSTRRVVLVTCDDTLGFREDGHRKANFVVVAEPA